MMKYKVCFKMQQKIIKKIMKFKAAFVIIIEFNLFLI